MQASAHATEMLMKVAFGQSQHARDAVLNRSASDFSGRVVVEAEAFRQKSYGMDMGSVQCL